MGCLVILSGLFWPRLILVILWIFTDYLARAFGSFVWPTLGFFFLPTTTIAYAIAQNRYQGVTGVGLLLVILGVALDLGILGGGARSRLFRR